MIDNPFVLPNAIMQLEAPMFTWSKAQSMAYSEMSYLFGSGQDDWAELPLQFQIVNTETYDSCLITQVENTKSKYVYVIDESEYKNYPHLIDWEICIYKK
jgi:hypothetical protein